MVLSTTISLECQPRGEVCTKRRIPTWSGPSLRGNASNEVIDNSARCSRTAFNSGAAGARALRKRPAAPPQLQNEEANFAKTFPPPFLNWTAQHALTGVVPPPGVRLT